jgi:peptide/nickel transport system substrate-binding protein
MSPTYAIKTGEHDNEVVDMHHYGVDYGEYEGYMAEHTCGTGPYQVTEWLKNQYVHMTYFEDYWRTDTTRTDITGKLALPSYAGSIKQAYIKTNEDVTTRVLNIRAGVSDGIYLPYTNAQDLLDLDTYDELYPDIHVSTGGTTFFVEHFGFNMKTVYDFNGRGVNLTSPFADINLRLCFAHAFNYTAYLTAAVQGFGVQAQGIIPQGLFGHVDDLPMYDTDLTKAAEYWELAMANPDTKAAFEAWEDNGGLPLGYNTGNTRREQACLILKDSIQKLYSQVTTKLTGVSQLTINIQGYEWSAYLDANRERNLACFIIGWIPDYADPDNYVFPYAYSRGTFAYRIGYNNSDVDEWYIQSRSEQSGTVRAQLFEQIEQAVYEDVPMIMVLQGGELRTWRTWVKGDGLLWNPMYTAGIEIGYMYYVYKDYGT